MKNAVARPTFRGRMGKAPAEGVPALLWPKLFGAGAGRPRKVIDIFTPAGRAPRSSRAAGACSYSHIFRTRLTCWRGRAFVPGLHTLKCLVVAVDSPLAVSKPLAATNKWRVRLVRKKLVGNSRSSGRNATIVGAHTRDPGFARLRQCGRQHRSDAHRHIAHNGSDRRRGMELAKAMQEHPSLRRATQMAAEAELKAKQVSPQFCPK